VIPPETTSRAYLERIVERLEGPESDAGSLTFTLALFEAARLHEVARGKLAESGLSSETLEAMRLATGAYERAFARARTDQGRCTVYTRVLRQIGEVFAAKQRLGVDPDFETPFSIQGAMEVYLTLQQSASDDGWADIGWGLVGAEAFELSMQRLWEEIQETTLNVADYYLARAVQHPARADDHARNAARLFEAYLAFFLRYATVESRAGIPDSAYFAAHESARGIGDAFLAYSAHPTHKEVELATRRYRNALELFPFDRTLWPALTGALERQGRETDYLSVVRPVAEWVTRSRSIATWVQNGEPGADDVAALRRALADTQVLMYLGFAGADELAELESGLKELEERHEAAQGRMQQLLDQRDGAPAETAAFPASADASAPAAPRSAAVDRAALNREIADLKQLVSRLSAQIEARARALPLFKKALATESLIPVLRAQRDHPIHTLLRRMYHEKRS